MIEFAVMKRMVRRGALLAPVAILAIWVLAGSPAALGAAAGIVLALGNLYLAGRVIGGIAENLPHLLLPAAMGAFGAGMLGLAGAALLLRGVEALDATYLGTALVAAHLVLVMWEASDAFLKIPSEDPQVSQKERSMSDPAIGS